MQDGEAKLSVFRLFSELFPELTSLKGREDKPLLTRLQFNKLGYAMYVKEQSRRVPAPKGKPGNPGYGFRRARWRCSYQDAEDARIMQETLAEIGLSPARVEAVRRRVEELRVAWDKERRPSRPAGPGRPRGGGGPRFCAKNSSGCSGDEPAHSQSPLMLPEPWGWAVQPHLPQTLAGICDSIPCDVSSHPSTPHSLGCHPPHFPPVLLSLHARA